MMRIYWRRNLSWNGRTRQVGCVCVQVNYDVGYVDKELLVMVLGMVVESDREYSKWNRMPYFLQAYCLKGTSGVVS